MAKGWGVKERGQLYCSHDLIVIYGEQHYSESLAKALRDEVNHQAQSCNGPPGSASHYNDPEPQREESRLTTMLVLLPGFPYPVDRFDYQVNHCRHRIGSSTFQYTPYALITVQPDSVLQKNENRTAQHGD
ncbi:hypothetical protein [Pseudomonas zeae]|uniref:hypothetical protein n=1 Tax=Pseudomonas zeae TaxID=2745510 RepID=UPI0039E11F67